MAELAEGARLLSEYGVKAPSRVRIPLSPPLDMIEPVFYSESRLSNLKIINFKELSIARCI